MRKAGQSHSLRAVPPALAALLAAWACNNLLGIDEGRLACVHTSNCPGTEVCLYERCSPECIEDRDCPDSEQCTQSEFGPRCIPVQVLECRQDADCQGGTACDQGTCRFPCTESGDCGVTLQRCEAGFCRASTGAGGGGGEAGGSASATGEAGGSASADGQVGGSSMVGETCQEGAYRCPLLSDTTREACRNGEWVSAPACPSGTLCDSGANGECTEIAEECLGKESGSASCDQAERSVCGEDLVSVTTETCLSAAHCIQATGPACAACLAGEYLCENDELFACNDQQTALVKIATCTDAPCNAVLGECTDRVCTANQYYCDAATNTLRRCNADETGFSEATECDTGICDAENGECDVCEPNATLGCDGDGTKTVCSEDGQDILQVSCADEDPNTPLCIGTGKCVSCVPGSAECLSNRERRTCDAQGNWQTPTTCVDSACLVDTCSGVCSPATTSCFDEASVQECGPDGTWGEPELCEDSACVGASCTGECEPDATTCADKFSIQTCTDLGSWGAAVTCTNQACSEGACSGNCVPETRRCSNGNVQTCSDQGTWSTTQTCSGQTCVQSSTSAACQGTCAPGYQRCNNNVVQNCNAAGSYSGTADNCTASNETCSETGSTASCGGECAPGQTACQSGAAHHCVNGAWSVLQNCSTPDEICSGGECVANDPYTVGEASATNFSAMSQFEDGFWWAVPVDVPRRVNVLALRFIGAAAGGNGRMALWENASSAPGAFITQTVEIPVASGPVGAAPATATVLEAGRYWLGAKFTAGAQFYTRTIAGRTAYTYDQTFNANPATTMSPFPVGSSAVEANTAFTFYLVVQDAP